MIIRSPPPRSIPSLLRPLPLSPRHLHARASASPPPIPPPTPFVPDPSTFLTLIGRNLSQHSAKIPTWTSLFSLTSTQLRELGVEPARTRRYLLWWRDRFRKGIFGVGGDLKNVKDGVAELRVVEVPVPERGGGPAASSLSTVVETGKGAMKMKKMVVNEPPEVVAAQNLSYKKLKSVEGVKVVGARTIVGPFVQPVKGTSGNVARINVQEGMWEVRKGIKVDGGERRKVQVRRKRLLQERKTKRT